MGQFHGQSEIKSFIGKSVYIDAFSLIDWIYLKWKCWNNGIILTYIWFISFRKWHLDIVFFMCKMFHCDWRLSQPLMRVFDCIFIFNSWTMFRYLKKNFWCSCSLQRFAGKNTQNKIFYRQYTHNIILAKDTASHNLRYLSRLLWNRRESLSVSQSVVIWSVWNIYGHFYMARNYKQRTFSQTLNNIQLSIQKIIIWVNSTIISSPQYCFIT